jgi:bacterioferritin-associated ferredoxin
MKEENIVICRCEDFTLKELRELLEQGFNTVEEIKRVARLGMGPCQGKTCGPLIKREIAKYTKQKIEDLDREASRPPYGGIMFGQVVGDDIEK